MRLIGKICPPEFAEKVNSLASFLKHFLVSRIKQDQQLDPGLWCYDHCEQIIQYCYSYE